MHLLCSYNVKFVSATIFDDDVKKILKKTVKAYFHDIRDRIDKRDSRRRVAVDNKKSDQRISPDTSMDLLDDGEN
uniref:Uncharacterized protein n=1 Tax=Trichobilharzia regenti TaxID=157069 RepID=A0AA85J1G0_TRIRE|nr:unnamed protein product [Trichobilharzia regenti]